MTWSGSTTTCNPGDIDAGSRAAVLGAVNFYRALAGLPAVADDASKNRRAQACSLMMEANNAGNHFPPTTWKCYSQEGASSAGVSNIAGINTLHAIGGYMIDEGNATTLGHRRWLLSNWLGPSIGIGSASTWSCLEVATGSRSQAPRAWTAWPPPGDVPLQSMTWPPPSLPFQGLNVDQTGWTIQSDSINLNSAVITVTEGGVNRPVSVSQLQAGIGSNYGVSFTPIGWVSSAGRSHTVNVTGVSKPFKYSVNFVNCP